MPNRLLNNDFILICWDFRKIATKILRFCSYETQLKSHAQGHYEERERQSNLLQKMLRNRNNIFNIFSIVKKLEKLLQLAQT